MVALRSACPVCQATKELRRCQRCMIVDRKDHKVACNAVDKARKKLETEEIKLRAAPPDLFLPANVFETSAGHFWGIFETRPYMRARFGVIEKLLKIKTYDAVKAAFDHMMDMFRLCRGDNMGLRFMVPALFIRLGNDQQCYDFLKWYVTTGRRGDYDWGDMDLPYLDIKDADVFEAVLEFTGEYDDIAFAAALMLIKMKLLKDVKTLQNSLFMYDEARIPLPAELVDRIRKLAVGKIVATRADIIQSNNHKPLIEKLEAQIQQLFQFVKKANKYFWTGLQDPADYLAARPDTYSAGSIEHAQLTVQFYYDAYAEMPDSILMISKLNTVES